MKTHHIFRSKLPLVYYNNFEYFTNHVPEVVPHRHGLCDGLNAEGVAVAVHGLVLVFDVFLQVFETRHPQSLPLGASVVPRDGSVTQGLWQSKGVAIVRK